MHGGARKENRMDLKKRLAEKMKSVWVLCIKRFRCLPIAQDDQVSADWSRLCRLEAFVVGEVKWLGLIEGLGSSAHVRTSFSSASGRSGGGGFNHFPFLFGFILLRLPFCFVCKIVELKPVEQGYVDVLVPGQVLNGISHSNHSHGTGASNQWG